MTSVLDRLNSSRRRSSALPALVLATVALWRLVLPVQPTYAAFNAATTNADNALTAQRIFQGSRSTSAWYWRDASGTGDLVRSAPAAFAGDGLYRTTANFATTYASERYIEFQYDGPVAAGIAVSDVAFNLDFAAGNVNDTVCIYLEVRRISTGTVQATHGGPGADVACQAGTSFTATTTQLPSITSSAQVNDLSIRIYGKSTGARGLRVDRATVTGSAFGPFTLMNAVYVDQATGTSSTSLWGAAARSDGSWLASNGNFGASYSSSRFHTFAFPRTVPTDAQISSVSLAHTFRPSGQAATLCYYMEVYANDVLVGTQGSPSADLACSPGSWTTVTHPMPEVSTVERANNLSVKLFFKVSQTDASQHDQVRLTVNYHVS